MRTISMNYKNHTNCQKKKKLVITASQETAGKSGSYHMLLKKVNAYKLDQCGNICNIILCSRCIVNIHYV